MNNLGTRRKSGAHTVYQEHMIRKREWIDSEIELAERLRFEGLPARVIGTILGRTQASVQSKLTKMGISKPALLREMYLDILTRPHSVNSAAKFLGVTRCAVICMRYRLKRAGFDIYKIRRGGNATKTIALQL